MGEPINMKGRQRVAIIQPAVNATFNGLIYMMQQWSTPGETIEEVCHQLGLCVGAATIGPIVASTEERAKMRDAFERGIKEIPLTVAPTLAGNGAAKVIGP